MKKTCFTFLIVFLSIGWIPHIHAKTPEVVLSDPLIIIEAGPVQLKFPGAEEYTAIKATRSFPWGTEIDPENRTPFNVLCPDFSFLENTIACPEVPPDIMRVVDSSPPEWPGWPILVLDPTKDQLSAYEDGLQRLEELPVTETDPGIKGLQCHLYAKTNKREEATICYYEMLEQFPDKEAEARIQYQLALIFWADGQRVESVDWAQEALKRSQEQGDSQDVFLDSQEYFLVLAADDNNEPELRGLARHHAALLYHYVFADDTEALQQAQMALEIYQELNHSELLERIQTFLNMLSRE